MKIDFIYRTSFGDFCIGYRKKLKTPKLKRLHSYDKEKTLLVDEIEIIRIPKEEINNWCLNNNLILEIKNKEIRYYERT